MRIKNLIILILVVVALAACNNQESPKWEYKIVQLTENDGLTLQEQAMQTANRMYGKYGADALLPIPYTDPTSQLNKLGKQGWELVNVYTTTETVFPNFGNEDYHTGVKSNTRTQTINFVFKRLATKTKDEDISSKVTGDSIAVVEIEEPVDTNAVDSVSPYEY